MNGMSIWCRLGLHDWERLKSSRIHRHDPMNGNEDQPCAQITGCWVYDKICMRLKCGAARLLARKFKTKWARQTAAEWDKERAKTERSQLAEEKASLRNIYQQA